MRRTLMILAVLALLVLTARTAAAVDEWHGVPVLQSVDPSSGKPGDMITAFGEYLGKPQVSDLYLTNGERDIKAEITEMTKSFVKFRIPAEAAPGKYKLMLLVTIGEPTLLEQPVTLTVE